MRNTRTTTRDFFAPLVLTKIEKKEWQDQWMSIIEVLCARFKIHFIAVGVVKAARVINLSAFNGSLKIYRRQTAEIAAALLSDLICITTSLR
jgi:hypothetical protein